MTAIPASGGCVGQGGSATTALAPGRWVRAAAAVADPLSARPSRLLEPRAAPVRHRARADALSRCQCGKETLRAWRGRARRLPRAVGHRREGRHEPFCAETEMQDKQRSQTPGAGSVCLSGACYFHNGNERKRKKRIFLKTNQPKQDLGSSKTQG